MERLQTQPSNAAATGTVRGTLQLLHLRAVAECTAKQDIRYYLNGVLVELHASAIILVATDGHRLMVARDSTEPPSFSDCELPLRFYLENDTVAQLLATFGKSKLPRFAFAFDLATGMVEFTGAASSKVSASANADTAAGFPSWRRVVPRKPSGTMAQFDPRYLCSAAKVAGMLGSRKLAPMMRIDHNGDSGAVITFGHQHEIAMVLMPYRMPDECKLDWLDRDRGSPEWR